MMDLDSCLPEADPPCPHCGYVMRDLCELGLRDGDDTGTACANCGNPITIECSIAIRYRVTPREAKNAAT